MEPERPTIPFVDTSALAKWYLHEAFSEKVEAFLRSLPFARISSLVVLEMRCLLARRRRNGELTPEQEQACWALLEDDIGQGFLQVLPLDEVHMPGALRLMDRLPEHPLRTLDALHLAIARNSGCEVLATADRVMSDAAEAIDIRVEGFFEPESPAPGSSGCR